MEFLFTDKWASIEALLVLICLGIMLFILAYQGYIFLRRVFAIFIKKRGPIWLASISSSIKEAQENLSTPQIEDSIVATKIEVDNEIHNDTALYTDESSHEAEWDQSKVSEEEIYAEYVALVDETHAEKEKQWEYKEESEENKEPAESKVEVIEENKTEVPSDFFDNEPTQGEELALDNNVLEEVESAIDTVVEEENEDIQWKEEPDDTQSPEIPQSEELSTEILPNKEEINEETVTDSELVVDITTDLWKEDIQATEDINTEEDKETLVDERVDSIVQEEQIDISSLKNETKVEEKIAPIDNWEQKNQNSARVEQNPPPVKNHSETLFALINTIRTVIARGQLIEARALIIQWLALDKWHRELNLMLGSLYEWERHLEKAEYVYKDLAIDFPDDIEILEKLGNVLIIEKRYSIALEIYKKILSLGWETEWTLYILSHLCHELNDANEGYRYMKKYLKWWPNNPEILALISEAEIELGKRKDAIETLKRLKNLTPYNGEITATLQKLMMEEELAGNFGEEK
jgi:tetratricopeptide (TPR) repeat protein